MPPESQSAQHSAPQHTVVELKNVSRSFLEGGQPRHVLRDVDLRIRDGERVALLGRSGSGKSTLLSLVAGIDAPSSGSLQIDGTELAELSETRRTLMRREKIGMVFQAFHLVQALTVAENVLLPIELAGRATPEHRQRAAQLLERVGLADRADSLPEKLSGGEQQRVAIARALVHAPRLLLADEPTGNLDEHTADAVLDLIDELCRAERRTLLIATHSRSCADRCDRVLRVQDGGLVEAAPA